jgi:hypothetical protein
MRYKFLAAVASLCIALASLSTPARAEHVSSHPPHEASSLTGPANTSQDTGNTDGHSALSLLDAVWIFGLTAAGLVLLRKVQGE